MNKEMQIYSLIMELNEPYTNMQFQNQGNNTIAIAYESMYGGEYVEGSSHLEVLLKLKNIVDNYKKQDKQDKKENKENKINTNPLNFIKPIKY